jgi:hypothetical protein
MRSKFPGWETPLTVVAACLRCSKESRALQAIAGVGKRMPTSGSLISNFTTASECRVGAWFRSFTRPLYFASSNCGSIASYSSSNT